MLAFLVIPSQSHAETTLATLNGEEITETEVMKIASKNMMKVLSQMYDIKRGAIESIIDDRLLNAEAKKRGTTVDKLVNQVKDKASEPTVEEAKTIYAMQKQKFNNKPYEEIEKQLLSDLRLQKRQIALNDFLDKLRESATIAINLERPRSEVSVDDDPFIGKKDAPVTLIEFSDFQCPYCKRARPTIDKILSVYKDQVRYVFRDFPLGFHKNAKLLAGAANCAIDQNKYWEFNRAIWESTSTPNKEKLDEIAKGLNLNLADFDKCLESNKYNAEMDKDQRDGAVAGVTGTPAYFINGMFISGAQPFENFKQLIDEELKK